MGVGGGGAIQKEVRYIPGTGLLFTKRTKYALL